MTEADMKSLFSAILISTAYILFLVITKTGGVKWEGLASLLFYTADCFA